MKNVRKSLCGSSRRIVETSGCSGDQVVDLLVSQVVGDPVARIDSNVKSSMRTVIEMLNVLGVFDEVYPAEVVVALLT